MIITVLTFILIGVFVFFGTAWTSLATVGVVFYGPTERTPKEYALGASSFVVASILAMSVMI